MLLIFILGRKSYHGFPKGKALLVDSPAKFNFFPMVIDTKNRFDDVGVEGFRAGIEPASSLAPEGASWSGLIECPCTTRTKKWISKAFATQTKDSCRQRIHEKSVRQSFQGFWLLFKRHRTRLKWILNCFLVCQAMLLKIEAFKTLKYVLCSSSYPQ